MEVYANFIRQLDNDNLINICESLKDEIMQYSHIEIKKKFNLPFFYGKTWVCYLNLVKNKEIELAFVRGRELPSKELLNFKDRAMIGGLTFESVSDIDKGVLKLLLDEAITLDQEKPYTFVKNKKKKRD